MNVYRYTTAGGKDAIDTYTKSLPKKVQYKYNSIIEFLEEEGMDAFQGQIREIRFDQQRLFYVRNFRTNVNIEKGNKLQGII